MSSNAQKNTARKNILRAAVVTTLLYGSFVCTGILYAAVEVEQVAVEAAGADFVVTPAKMQLVIEAGESQQVELLVTNRLGEEKTFEFTVEDIQGSSNPDETIVLLGDDRGPYSLKDYVSLEETSITLQHGERARVPITVSVPQNAEPGGLYGSVLVSTKSSASEGVSDADSSARSVLVTRISSLVFVAVPGSIDTEGELVEFTTIPDQDIFSGGPMRFSLVFQNSGSIHLNPFGRIEITDMFGRSVAIVEVEQWFALPDSVRFREVVWDERKLFGRYTAEAIISRGYGDLVDSKTVTFYVIQWQLVGIALGIVVLIAILLRFVFRSFEFRRKDTKSAKEL